MFAPLAVGRGAVGEDDGRRGGGAQPEAEERRWRRCAMRFEATRFGVNHKTSSEAAVGLRPRVEQVQVNMLFV